MERLGLRILFSLLLLLSAGIVIEGYITDPTVGKLAGDTGGDYYELYVSGELTVGDRDNITVITAQDAPVETSKAIYAFGPNGELIYYNTSLGYNDVDPVPGTNTMVMYVASKEVPSGECPDTYEADTCTQQLIERLNISTGGTYRLYTTTTPGRSNTNYHDVDRYNETTYVVADIYADRVYLLNVTTGNIVWQWRANEDFPKSGGGPKDDWTHLNDVEVLEDGRIMASLRNQDQVVFLDPTFKEDPLQKSWTLGEENNYSIMYEQHNPDYISKENGGPAVVVADSQNNRVIEYQRVDGEWKLTWVWSNKKVKWPRDADRLPNGHTLIVDSNGNRVIEVNRVGKIVWSAQIPYPYDAERLGTGDESAGGPSATKAGLVSVSGSQNGEWAITASNGDTASGLLAWLAKMMNAIWFVIPSWMGRAQVIGLTIFLITVLTWVGVEAKYYLPMIVEKLRTQAIESKF